jgi:hypothetical protein
METEPSQSAVTGGKRLHEPPNSDRAPSHKQRIVKQPAKYLARIPRIIHYRTKSCKGRHDHSGAFGWRPLRRCRRGRRREVREAEARLRRKRMEFISDHDANSIHL